MAEYVELWVALVITSAAVQWSVKKIISFAKK